MAVIEFHMKPPVGRKGEGMAKAPFTAEQVESLNAFQTSRMFHPFTCGVCSRGVLKATVAGWVCKGCDYTQDWAHDFMADGSWNRAGGEGHAAIFGTDRSE